MKVEQFVMAYKVEQDRLRAMMPEGFESLRPVLRINVEISTGGVYLEFNTPAAAYGKRGWLNIGHWSSRETEITSNRKVSVVEFNTPFLEIVFTAVGIEGSCPAEKDNDGCWFIGDQGVRLIPPETIDANKEYCDCRFKWKFNSEDAQGISVGGRTIPAVSMAQSVEYERMPLTAEAAAGIRCEQMLGQYKVIFERRMLG